MAVQTLSYEVRMAYLEKEKAAFPKAEIPEYSRHEEFEMLFSILKKC